MMDSLNVLSKAMTKITVAMIAKKMSEIIVIFTASAYGTGAAG
ncbi:hypothetical protein AwPolaro_01080 [Polaromonas sp.]|nr:hypothetical protein AwPolaro_01080 [Polaromonas sp.]